MIKKGQIYSHYKKPNKRYEILDLGLNTESMEEMVIYKALYQGEFKFGQIWVRPKKMFEESVEKNGERIARFKLIEE
jgi:cyclomaltodextrinase / maltogenic alpha-amylase / neopullulanase